MGEQLGGSYRAMDIVNDRIADTKHVSWFSTCETDQAANAVD